VSDDLVRAYIEHAKTQAPDLFDAWIQVYLTVRNDREAAWELVLKLVDAAAGDSAVLGAIGAGPLEDLIRLYPVPILERAEAEATHNPPFAEALETTYYPGHGL